MAGCCRFHLCEEMFNARAARKSLARYRKRGLLKIEREILADVRTVGLSGARVLDIGGGIGAIQAELLTAGAAEGEIVELVAAYEPYAQKLAREKGLERRSTFRVADAIEEPDSIAPADIVVLNRVVCCSPDGIRLTGLAARLATRLLVVSYPRDRWFIRTGARLLNGVFLLIGKTFRVFLHPRDSLFAAAIAEGLTIETTGRNFGWEFAVLRRAG